MIVIIILILQFPILGFAQTKIENWVPQGVESYIKRKDSISDSKYNVYVIKFYKNKSCMFCYSISYILNSLDYQSAESKYFIKVGEHTVLTRFDSISTFKFLTDSLTLKVYSFSDYPKSEINVRNKLLLVNGQFITYDPDGAKYCKMKNGKSTAFYYESYEYLPKKESYFTPLNENFKIEKVR